MQHSAVCLLTLSEIIPFKYCKLWGDVSRQVLQTVDCCLDLISECDEIKQSAQNQESYITTGMIKNSHVLKISVFIPMVATINTNGLNSSKQCKKNVMLN